MNTNQKRTPEELKHCKSVATVIYQQIIGGIGKQKFGAWKCSKTFFTYYNNHPSLMLLVSAASHQGWVLVSLDEGTDTYIVILLSENNDLKRIISDVYCDNVGEIIDENVSQSLSMTEGCITAENQSLVNEILK